MLFAHRRTLSENSISTSCSKSPRSWTKVEVQTRRSRHSLSQRGAATSSILKALMRNIRRRARKTNNVSCGGSSKSGINRYKNAGRIFIFMWNRLLGEKKQPNKLNLASVLSQSSAVCLKVSALKHCSHVDVLLPTLSGQLSLYEIVFDFVHWLITVYVLTACIVQWHVYLCLYISTAKRRQFK